MPRAYGLSGFLLEKGVFAREACLNGGRGICPVVAVHGVREGGVPVEKRLVGMDSSRCPVAALWGSQAL